MDLKRGIRPIENILTLRNLLAHIRFPARKEEIFKKALTKGVDMNVMTLVQSLPDRRFKTYSDVFRQLGFKNMIYG